MCMKLGYRREVCTRSLPYLVNRPFCSPFLVNLSCFTRVTCCSFFIWFIRSIMLNVLRVSVVAVRGPSLESNFKVIKCEGIVAIRPVRKAATFL